MGDSSTAPNPNVISEPRVYFRKKQSITHLTGLATKVLSEKTAKSITSAKQRLEDGGIVGNAVIFLAITAALEIVKRISSAKCPFVWRSLQALQVLHIPPFKWLQRWHPFKELATCTKKLSKPLLVLSVATLFSDDAGHSNEASDGADQSQDYSRSRSLPSSERTRPDTGASTSADWLVELRAELRRQGIRLPDRLGEDELRRFYAAVRGDFKKLILAVRKTIDWRQGYQLLQPQEFQAWSHLLFWHGHDIRQRPCLIIRLGLACSSLQSTDMPLFVKAVVSQIEHGVLNLVTLEQPQIMVLMDCLGLSPFGFPVHMMQSCATVLQDHYPNRLGCLMIIRLPQLARVIMQTLFQVLRPGTRRKVRTVGRNYLEVLAECLDSVPAFLGGNCACSGCSGVGTTTIQEGDGDGDGVASLVPQEAEHQDVHVSEMHHNIIIGDEYGDYLKWTMAISALILCGLFIICLRIRVQETLAVVVLEKIML